MIEVILLVAIGGLMHAVGSFTSTASGTELAFGYLLLVAYLGGRVVNRMGMPRLTGYLLAGVISGPFVIALVSDNMTSSLKIVNDVATCILGLTAGGELNLKRVQPVLDTLRAITVFGVVAAMFVLSVLVFVLRPFLPMFDALSFTQSLAVSLMLGVGRSAQSPSVVMALLSETRADGPLSQLILATVVVADLVVVVAYTMVAAITGAILGGRVELGETIIVMGWELFGSMGFGVVIGMLLSIFLRRVEKGAVAFAFMVCVVVAEIGVRIHLDPLVVMLAAGVWLENFSRADAGKLLHRFDLAQVPVFLVFFALAGTKVDLSQLWATIIPVVLIAGARAATFYYGCRVACARTHAEPVIANYGWTGLIPQAGLSLALVVVIRNSFPTFGAAAGVLLLSVVALNQLIAPVLLRMTLVRSNEVGKRAQIELAGEH